MKVQEVPTTVHLPQYMVYTLNPSGMYWQPEIINYNGNPYMLASNDLNALHTAWLQEDSIDPLDEFRVVDLQGGQLYQLSEDRASFVEILHSVYQPDLSWLVDH